MKRSNMRIIGLPEGQEEQQGLENLFEEIMTENFPDMGKIKVTQKQKVNSEGCRETKPERPVLEEGRCRPMAEVNTAWILGPRRPPPPLGARLANLLHPLLPASPALIGPHWGGPARPHPCTRPLVKNNWNEIIDSFDDMNLSESFLCGIYAYGFEKPSAI
ncbi:hypothetical protein QTO34_019215 [Cnephaeus nilssonii]|uniref:DEAD-box RNA helicase Q domain-containing protein n=1 Tax=Cnephaeus nilssonii TaxID=3371016 RepID=A0AA40HXA0_CNENI|nr:hypothetical protein QTO34_019215 [Eptesicus nilssonii]